MWRLPADFWKSIEKGLHHLPSDLKESMIPTLPFQISVDPIRNHLRAAFQETNSIKWMNLLKGRMSHRWQQFAMAHVRSKNSTYGHNNGAPNSSLLCGTIPFEYGIFANDAFHGDANTQVKRYKLEELERKKTQIWKRYIELQPILHRFQHKQFESPDTVNNLRYDSQKCCTALAKLFIDEAASRSPSTDNELLPQHLTTRAGIG
jgi:hypothetical protein